MIPIGNHATTGKLARCAWKSMRPRNFTNQPPASRVTYDDFLRKYPITTKSITSGVIAGSSDAACQIFVEKNKRYDFMRSLRFGFLGLALVGPVCHHWYGYLAHTIPSQTVSGIAKRVALDQFVVAPLFLSFFCSSLWMLENRQFGSFSVYYTHLRQTMPGLVAANWGLWIPSMAFNFRFVPVQYQVLASNVIALVWNVYLSFKATKK